jgi:hypothetical protein
MPLGKPFNEMTDVGLESGVDGDRPTLAADDGHREPQRQEVIE